MRRPKPVDRPNNIVKAVERKKIIFAASQKRILTFPTAEFDQHQSSSIQESFNTMRLTVENPLCYKSPDCY